VGDAVVASCEVNLSNFIGSDYAEQTFKMTDTPAARASGVSVDSIRFSALIQHNKDKHLENMQ